MTAEIRKIITPFYDAKAGKMKFKYRPGIVLKHISGDYVIIPVSTISDKRRIDPDYDIPVSTAAYPKLNLAHDSYVRTNKQTVVHQSDIGDKISDFHAEYPQLFSHIVDKIEEFNNSIIEDLRNLK